MSTVTDLENKVESLRGQLQSAEKSLAAARLEASGLVPMQTVLIHTGSKKEFLFTNVRSWAISKKPWVYGKMKKVDGTWGEREVLLYSDWERTELKP